MFGSFEVDCPVCQVEQEECQGKQQPEKNMIMHRYKTKQKHTMPLSGLSCNFLWLIHFVKFVFLISLCAIYFFQYGPV